MFTTSNLCTLVRGNIPSDIGYLLAKNPQFGLPFMGINTIGLGAVETVRMAVSTQPNNKHLCSNSVHENVLFK